MTYLKAVLIDGALCSITIGLSRLFSVLFGMKEGKEIVLDAGAGLLDKLRYIIPRYGLNLLTSGGILPMGFLLAVIGICAVFIIWILGKRDGIKSVLFFIGVLLAMGILPPLVTIAEETPYVPARILTAGYGAVGGVLLIASVLTYDKEKKGR